MNAASDHIIWLFQRAHTDECSPAIRKEDRFQTIPSQGTRTENACSLLLQRRIGYGAQITVRKTTTVFQQPYAVSHCVYRFRIGV